MFIVAANTRQALVGQKEWITTGSSGIQVQFLFSADWDGLAKFAVFRNAEIEESAIPIALPASGLTELPAENCAAEYVDEKVYVGVYGTDGLGHIIIPTIWVSLGVLKEGAAYEGMDPPQPTQDMWAQILAIAQNAGAENAAAAEQSAEEAAASAEAIQDMNVEAETLPDESPLTVTKEVDPKTGAVTLVFGLTRGPKGTKGDDGYSPTITITPIQGGHRFTVTDKDHPTGQSFDVMNGAPGAPGSPGQDGYSPTITITTITGGHRFTVTDEDHPTGQSFDVMDGVKGDAGYSPAVTITTITGGHRVTITDEDHPTGQSFDVLDGASDAGQVSYDPTQTYQSGTVGKELSDQKNAIGELNRQLSDLDDDKQDAPSTAGTAGQVLGLDSNLDPVWVNQSGGGGDVSNCAPIIINTASGDVASFADGADNRQIRKIVGTIVPVQGGTGDPSPTNVRPISGWTGANIYGRNANIATFSELLPRYGTSSFGVNLTVSNGKLTFSGTATGSGIKFFGAVPEYAQRVFHVKAGVKYTVSCKKSSAKPGLQGNIISDNGQTQSGWITTALVDAETGRYYGYFTPTANGRVAFLPIFNATSGETVSETIEDIQLVVGNSKVYQGESEGIALPINWQTEAGTVYGGTVTLNEDGSADVVSDMGLDTKSSSDIALRILNNGSSGYNVYRLRMPVEYGNVLISNQYKQYPTVNDAVAAGGGIAIGNKTGSNLYISVVFPWVSGDTNETADARLLANTLQIGYTLATAQSWHFDNIGTLMTYFGTNNVWIDTGSITECDYPADTKLYIDGITAPDEDMIANSNIASGKYFVVNNQLYLSTAAIAAGASIVPGTNCTATNLAEALNALNS